MLPNELGKLSAALANSTAATLDAQRLGAELAGLATFHKELFDQDLLTQHQRDLLHEKWRFSITAPSRGVPVVVEKKGTVPVGGLPPVKRGTGGQIVCPLCHGTGTLTL
jgi:hypothetical protein